MLSVIRNASAQAVRLTSHNKLPPELSIKTNQATRQFFSRAIEPSCKKNTPMGKIFKLAEESGIKFSKENKLILNPLSIGSTGYIDHILEKDFTSVVMWGKDEIDRHFLTFPFLVKNQHSNEAVKTAVATIFERHPPIEKNTIAAVSSFPLELNVLSQNPDERIKELFNGKTVLQRNNKFYLPFSIDSLKDKENYYASIYRTLSKAKAS